MNAQRKTVCVDLDGVLNLYDGWKGPLWAEPRSGASDFMQGLIDAGYEVAVLTTRDEQGTRDWLTRHSIPFDTVTNEKLKAICYIDDRAICFTGSFDELTDRVKTFKAHWE